VTVAVCLCVCVLGVYLNTDLCSPLKSIHSKTLQCGQLSRLSVKLQNNSSSSFPVSYLVLEPYWFSDELRKIVKGQTGKILHSNTLVTRVPQASRRRCECGVWMREKAIVHVSSHV